MIRKIKDWFDSLHPFVKLNILIMFALTTICGVLNCNSNNISLILIGGFILIFAVLEKED